jgi:hypothetical protein
MKLAADYPLLEDSKAQRVADLSIREAIKLLSSPKIKPLALDGDGLPETETLHLESNILSEDKYPDKPADAQETRQDLQAKQLGLMPVKYAIEATPEAVVEFITAHDIDWLEIRRIVDIYFRECES